jgi:F-box-like
MAELPLRYLPNEVWARVLLYLDVRSFLRLRLVSRHLHALATDPLICRRFYRGQFGSAPVSEVGSRARKPIS